MGQKVERFNPNQPHIQNAQINLLRSLGLIGTPQLTPEQERVLNSLNKAKIPDSIKSRMRDRIMQQFQSQGSPGTLGSPNTFTPPQNPLALQVQALLSQSLGSAPEVTALHQAQNMLSNVGMNPFQELSFTNQFSELQDPYGTANPLGGFGAGQSVVAAALPVWAQGLRQANAQLTAAAPSRFSSAFVQEGTDLNTQALRDLNLFQQQALLQGLGLDSAERGQLRSFLQGARGLQQQAVQDVAQNTLAARGLQQQAEATAQQGRLGSAELLGQLSAQAGMNPFNRMLAAGQFGLQSLNPTLDYLNMLLSFLRPQPDQPIVRENPFVSILKSAAGIVPLFGGDKQT